MKKLITTALLAILLGSCSLGLSEKSPEKGWEIDGYKIIYTRKLGWSGPHYYEYDVYKNGRYISSAAQDREDSCKLRFK